MASTYVNDLRLNEMATGDASGTWGSVTNTNLELIGEALGYGTEAITTNADTHTTTVADGATDPGRAMYLKYTGTLDSACTITIAPNTISRMHFIENGTSGSQNIIISQGSGANITIPAGDTKAVYLDGAGSGAAVVDAFASLSVVDLKVQDDLTVTDDLIVNGDIDLEGNMDVNGSLETDALSLNGTTVTSTAAEINLLDGSSANTVVNSKAVIYGSSGEVAGTLATAAQPNITSVGTLTGFTSTGIDDNADATAITINSSEQVGIGVTPVVTLDVGGTSDLVASFRSSTNNGNTSEAKIRAVDSDSSHVAIFQYQGYQHRFQDASANELVRIDNSGNVGIGTASPNYKLEINHTGADTNALVLNDEDTVSNATGLYLRSTSEGRISFGSGAALTFAGAGGGSERMRIDASGNVGIGDTSPEAILHVSGVAPTYTNSTTVFYGGTTNSGTKNGISLWSSGDALSGGLSSNLLFANSSTPSQTNTARSSGNIQFANITTASKTSEIKFGGYYKGTTSFVENMRIDGSGNVGIGTTSPDTELTIVGGIKVSQSALTDSITMSVNTSSSYAQTITLDDVGLTFDNNSGSRGYRFGNNGTERMRIDSSGRLLLGETSNNDGAAVQIDANSAGSTVYSLRVENSNTATDVYNGIRLIQGASGSAVGIMATGGSTTGNVSYRNVFHVGTQNATSLVLGTNDTERMRIDTSGNFLVGNTITPSSNNQGAGFINTGASGLVQWQSGTTTTSSVSVGRFYNPNGNVGSIQLSGSATSYVTSSDYRLKENVRPIENGLERLNNLKPVQFDWKSDGTSSEGFIAHEAQEVFPDAVSGEKDGEEMQGMDYGRITPLLVKAIQEQQEQIEQLKAEIQTLKGE